MKFIIYISILLFSFSLKAQEQNMLDRLNNLHLKRLENRNKWEVKDSLNRLIYKTIVSDLSEDFIGTDTTHYYLLENKLKNATKGVTLAYAFMNNIVINSTEDFTIFSTDVLDNGSYHEYLNYIRYKTDKNWKVLALDKNQNDKSAGYFRIEKLDNFYILFGYGTYGSGKQHFVIRIFEKNKAEIRECFNCYPKQKMFFIECNRSQNIDLNFDTKTKEFSFKQFKMDDDTGFYTREFDLIKYKFSNGVFIRK
ncbi:hypothetical protein [uncultured Tenacibaculum sp.]|uniref:hypothetical protein n=1 Tax=uncultured Tenacibaculum sp. TaxID=174713 RepID=UPI00261CFCE2|nr:hypothetical protein [uncultured Tenacibaculum sp.]